MRVLFSLFLHMFVAQCVLASGLPLISIHPTNQIVSPATSAGFAVASANATGFQWCHNGTDIVGATNASLTITNAAATDIGYYLAVVKNETGWVPSGMAYLAVTDGGGLVPFSNLHDTNALVFPFEPVGSGSAQALAGPELDQMQPVGGPGSIEDGYFHGADRLVLNVAPGEAVYYRVEVVVTNFQCPYGCPYLSTTLQLTAGGDAFPTPVAEGLRFGLALGWPPPALWPFDCSVQGGWAVSNQTLVPGELARFNACPDGLSFGWELQRQWRKDGAAIPGATNGTLIISNVQPSDAGVYDLQVFGVNWWPTNSGWAPETSAVQSEKYYLSIQTSDVQPVLVSPGFVDSNFLCGLEGINGRDYALERSTNLIDWSTTVAVTNLARPFAFTNASGIDAQQFYRARLLPLIRSTSFPPPYALGTNLTGVSAASASAFSE